jgi:O-antigen/teichoic acid export membrane protein
MVILSLKLKTFGKDGVGKKITFRKLIKDVFNYGSYLSLQNFINVLSKEIQYQAIGLLDDAQTVTGYRISYNFKGVTFQLIGSLNVPFLISFSSLNAQNKNDLIIKIYKKAFTYFAFLLMLISGVLYFASDFILFFIYGESYLTYLFILQISIIIPITSVLSPLFISLLKAKGFVKPIVPISIFTEFSKLFTFLILLILFNLNIAMVGLLITNFIILIIILILNEKILKIKFSISEILKKYGVFFASFILTIITKYILLDNLRYIILELTNLSYFKHLNILSIIVFISLYFLFNYIFKSFKKEDIKIILEFFHKDTFPHKMTRFLLRLISKIIR